MHLGAQALARARIVPRVVDLSGAGSRFRLSAFRLGFTVLGFRFRVQGAGCSVQCAGFRVQGAGVT